MPDTVTIPRDLFDLLAALPQWPTEHPCPDCDGTVGHGYDCPAARPYWDASAALDRWRREQEVDDLVPEARCKRCGGSPVVAEVEGRVLVCATCRDDDEFRAHAERDYR